MAAAAYIGFVVLASVLLFVVLPRRRLRAVEALQSQLGEGDEIMTSGGLFGRIARLDQDSVDLEIAPQTVVRFARGAVARRISGPESADSRGISDAESTSADESTD